MRALTSVFVVASSQLLLTASAPAQAQEEGQQQEKGQEKKQDKEPAARPSGPQDLAKRVEELEAEIERLRLQQSGEEADEEEAGGEVPSAPAAAGPVSANAFNPTVTAVGNALYRHDNQDVLSDGTPIDNQFILREVELDLRAAVDPFADGVFIVSFESEVPGEFEAGVEEGYVIIKRLPVPVLDEPPFGLQFKIGRFRPEIGRINVLHLHDLPQMTRPLVIEEFYGEEGYIGDGASARMLLPGFDNASAFELTGQVLTGGGTAVADGPAQSPAVVGNLRWFRNFGGDHNVDVSAIFHYGRTDPAARRSAYTMGADFLYKWKPLRRGEFSSFVLGGQVFASHRDFVQEIDSDGDGVPDLLEEGEAFPLGYFAFAQVQVSRTTYAGFRWDDTATITDDSVRRHAILGYLTWYTSEFLRLRLGFEHRLSDLAAEDGRNSVFAELNVVFGAHPPEPFWVNK